MQKNSPQKILVVDDEPSDRILLRKILSKNYIITEASNGEEAVDSARSEKPALILMDIMMPKLDQITNIISLRNDHYLYQSLC